MLYDRLGRLMDTLLTRPEPVHGCAVCRAAYKAA